MLFIARVLTYPVPSSYTYSCYEFQERRLASFALRDEIIVHAVVSVVPQTEPVVSNWGVGRVGNNLGGGIGDSDESEYDSDDSERDGGEIGATSVEIDEAELGLLRSAAHAHGSGHRRRERRNALVGFDRLRAHGLSREEVSSLRGFFAQAVSTLSHVTLPILKTSAFFESFLFYYTGTDDAKS